MLPAILPVTFSAETTFELRLNPPAFKLPASTLPDPLTTPEPNNILPPVILPVVEIVLDPKLANRVATLLLP